MTLPKNWKNFPAAELAKVKSLRLEQIALGEKIQALTLEIRERHDTNSAALQYAELKRFEFEALGFEVDAIFKRYED